MLASNKIVGENDLSTFIPRKVRPAADNKNYLTPAGGGYNLLWDCSPNGPRTEQGMTFPRHSALPNCTGYCWGRWRELLGYNPAYYCFSGNAATWWDRVRNETTGRSIYRTGRIPFLGAIAVWGTSSSSAFGHVAIVEKVNPDLSIEISESNYIFADKSAYSSVVDIPVPFRTREISNSGTLQNPYYRSASGKLPFLGFIYLPKTFDRIYDSGKTEEPVDTAPIISNIEGSAPLRLYNGTITFPTGTYKVTLAESFDPKMLLAQSNNEKTNSKTKETVITYKVLLNTGLPYYPNENIFSTNPSGLISKGNDISIVSNTAKIIIDPKTQIKYSIAKIKIGNNYYYSKINNITKNESYVTR